MGSPISICCTSDRLIRGLSGIYRPTIQFKVFGRYNLVRLTTARQGHILPDKVRPVILEYDYDYCQAGPVLPDNTFSTAVE